MVLSRFAVLLRGRDDHMLRISASRYSHSRFIRIRSICKKIFSARFSSPSSRDTSIVNAIIGPCHIPVASVTIGLLPRHRLPFHLRRSSLHRTTHHPNRLPPSLLTANPSPSDTASRPSG